MNCAKHVKKSETLEVRLSHEAKSAFMARCRDDGLTASEVVRRFIEREIAGGRDGRGRRSRRWSLIAASLAGLTVGAVAAPSLAHPARATRAVFDRLDRNHDGVLSFAEFRRD